jgi:hypothetical protein
MFTLYQTAIFLSSILVKYDTYPVRFNNNNNNHRARHNTASYGSLVWSLSEAIYPPHCHGYETQSHWEFL